MGLITQCKALGLPFLSVDDVCCAGFQARFDVIVDAIFGFSFKAPVRSPFDTILASTTEACGSAYVVSVDIPSGWDVTTGDSAIPGFSPDMLVSLTAPKLAAKAFEVCSRPSPADKSISAPACSSYEAGCAHTGDATVLCACNVS